MADISETIQEIANQELARNAIEFTQETANKYKNILTALQKKLQAAINKEQFEKDFDISIISQLKDLNIESHLSIKKGAYITEKPIDELEQETETIFKDNNFKRRRDYRRSTSKLNADFISLASEAMNIVYSLRQDITQNLEERLGLTYIGETKSTSYFKLLIVPMHVLLVNLNNFINLGIDKETGEYALSISVAQNLITNLQNTKGAVDLEITKNIKKDFYDRINILRTDVNYDVIEENDKYTQSGFVSEALGRLKLGVDKTYTYSQDNFGWQKHSDYSVTTEFKKIIGISNKNIAKTAENKDPTAPTLLRLNGFINNTLTEIIDILNIQDNNIQIEKLKTYFTTKQIADQVENDVYTDTETMTIQQLQI